VYFQVFRWSYPNHKNAPAGEGAILGHGAGVSEGTASGRSEP
jgi:hypothetical protein